MSPCVACGGGDARPFHPGLLRCAACGHGWADLELSPAEQAALYGREYFFGDEYRDYPGDKKALQKGFRRRLAVLEKLLGPERRPHLLEVGSAYGFFLELARPLFDTATGVDVSGEAVRYAREELGLDVRHGDLLDQDFGTRRFDLVCLWDTIEHLSRPDLVVARIAALTDPGAFVAVTTGDLSSLNARLAGKRWRLIHPPTHLHYFTRASLLRLLDRCGFEAVHDRSCAVHRSVDSMAHGLFVLRWKTPRLYGLVRRLGLAGIDVPLDLGDIRYVVARRR